MTLPEKICLVIPCYNEEKRLDLNQFKSFDDNCLYVFVNDGSKDGTLELIKKNSNENIHILNLEKNSGKAEAVRQGMLFVKTLPEFERIGWVGYWDADMATPLYELHNFISYSDNFYPDACAIFGSRIKKLGGLISRSPWRHYSGRVFATIASTVLRLECYDSQCGAKLFKKELIDAAFGEKFISRWIFDIEILLRLSKFGIIEYPLNQWTDVPGSKVKVLRVAIRTLVEIYKIKRKYLREN